MLEPIACAAAGWLCWSAGHYAVHRCWHRGMLLRPDARPPVYHGGGERTHHRLYDRRPAPHPMDAGGRYANTPFREPLILACLIAAAVAAPLGWRAAPAYLAGWLAAMGLDWLVHRAAHHAGPPAGYRGFVAAWLIRRHDRNYAIASGVWLDWLLGTSRGS